VGRGGRGYKSYTCGESVAESQFVHSAHASVEDFSWYADVFDVSLTTNTTNVSWFQGPRA
jgi:hypothetical protein